MLGTHRCAGLTLVVSALSCASCRSTSSDVPPPPEPLPALPSDTAGAVPTTPPPPAAKPDPVALDALTTGLATMRPRITAQVEAAAKIDVTQHSRLFMHPGDAKRASVTFDTTGLRSLELAPFIEDLRSNPDCAGPRAGVVRLSWWVDGAKKGELLVDRSYSGTVAVDLVKSSRLELDVDEGNETTLCDWFSVGVLNVK